ncbi:transcriptional regulator [Prauserella marina]|nr:winged helix-turn-helix domain-containing protein [Prauserella marina]ASR38199.1 transcriptional regulator [Prauserella marina]
MSRSTELAGLAALIADPTRAAFCLALLDGRAWTVTELARQADVAASTASEHLSRLVDGGLLVERRQGRHRYLQLAGPHVADLLEGLAAHVDPVSEPRPTLRGSRVSAALARGRTCYDHLAGRLGVTITDAMADKGLLDLANGCALTPEGSAWLVDSLGVAPSRLRDTRRPLGKACLDWTERRTHVAGLAGALVCRTFIGNAWLKRIGSGRAVAPTDSGIEAIGELLGIDLAVQR